MSSRQQLGSGISGLLHVGVKIVHPIGSREWPEFSLLVEWIANLQALHLCDELALEFVRNGFRDDEALGGDAGLPIVLHARLNGGAHCGFEVGTGHDDEGIAAPEFED